MTFEQILHAVQGHSAKLVEARTTEEADELLKALSLHRVQELLEQAIGRQRDLRPDDHPQAQRP